MIANRRAYTGNESTLTRKLVGIGQQSGRQTSISSFIGFSEILENRLTEIQVSGHGTCIQRIGEALFSHLITRVNLRKIDIGRLDLLYGGIDEDVNEGIFEPFLFIAIESNRILHNNGEEQSPETVPTGSEFESSEFEECLNGLSDAGHIQVSAGMASDPLDPEMFVLALRIRDSEIYPGSPGKTDTNDDSRRYGGTGIGLYITKRLLEEMPGRIRIMNSSVGLGNTFASTFILRCSGPALRRTRPTAARAGRTNGIIPAVPN